MDGITVGRKVDLNAYTSYESLMQALEEMFQPSYSGMLLSQKFHYLNFLTFFVVKKSFLVRIRRTCSSENIRFLYNFYNICNHSI